MSFQFSLEAVLRLRRSQKRAEELRLAGIHAEMARLHALLASLAEQVSSLAQWAQSGQHQAYAAELHFLHQQRVQLTAWQEQTHRELVDCETQRQEQQLRLQAAYQAVEVLDSLRHEQALLFQTERARRDQIQTDERTLQQRAAKQRMRNRIG